MKPEIKKLLILSFAAGISLTAAIQFSKEECSSTCYLTNSRF